MDKNLETLFVENGFTIKNAAVFAKEADVFGLDNLIDKLVDLKKRASTNNNILDFARPVMTTLESINNLVNDDEYSRLSEQSKLNSFYDTIKNIQSNFGSIDNYLKAERDIQLRRESMFDVMRRLYELDKNKSLSDSDKTSEALKLYSAKKGAEDAYNEAFEIFMAEKKNIKEFEVVDLKNKLLKLVNELQMGFKDLALKPQSKEEIQGLISQLRNDVAYYGIDTIKAKDELDLLCKRVGVEYVSTEMNLKVKEEEKREKKKKEEEPTVIETKSDNKLEGLLSKLKELNPGVEFALSDDLEDRRYDGKILSSIAGRDLVLPEGYYYLSNGITNRFSLSVEPLTVLIGRLERIEKQTENKNIEKPIENDFFATPEETLDEIKEEPEVIAPSFIDSEQEGTLENNHKYEVKKRRTAIIGEYPKSLLKASAITYIASKVQKGKDLGANLLTGIRNASSNLYHKITDGTGEKVEEFETEANVDKTKETSLLASGVNKLMDRYKLIRSRISRHNEPEELEQNDDLEDLSSAIDDLSRGTGR